MGEGYTVHRNVFFCLPQRNIKGPDGLYKSLSRKHPNIGLESLYEASCNLPGRLLDSACFRSKFV